MKCGSCVNCVRLEGDDYCKAHEEVISRGDTVGFCPFYKEVVTGD